MVRAAISSTMTTDSSMLKVHTQEFRSIAILYLKGRVVIGETKVLRDAVLAQCDASLVVVDFARVSGIDAHGLGVWLELHELSQAQAIEFQLMNLSRMVRYLLEITCLNTVFKITSETEVFRKALGHLPVSTVENPCFTSVESSVLNLSDF